MFYKEFDLTGVKTYPLEQRPSKVWHDSFAKPWDPATGFGAPPHEDVGPLSEPDGGLRFRAVPARWAQGTSCRPYARGVRTPVVMG